MSLMLKSKSMEKLSAIDLAIITASSFFWSWLLLVAFMPVLCEGSPSRSLYVIRFSAAMLAGSTVFALSASRKKVAFGFLETRWREGSVVFAGSAGSLLCFFGESVGSVVFDAMGALVIGACAACYLLTWSVIYSRGGARSASIAISGAMCGAMLICLVVGSLPDFWEAVVVAGLPPLAFFSLMLTNRMAEGSAASVVDPPSALSEAFGASRMLASGELTDQVMPFLNGEALKTQRSGLWGVRRTILLAMALLGLSLGMMMCLFLSFGPMADASGRTVSFVLCLSSALAMLAVLRFAPSALSSVLAVVLGVGLVAGAVLPLDNVAGSTTAQVVLLSIAGVAMLVVVWMELSEYALRSDLDAVSVFGGSFAAVFFAAALGFSATWFLLSPFDTRILARDEAVSLAVVLLVIVVFLLMVPNSVLWILARANASSGIVPEWIERSEKLTRGAEGFTSLKGEVAQRFGLTEREAEVLEHLLHGRSRPRIAQMLGVSENTINSHVQHIYRKADVHSYQELLDLIESQ